MNDGRYKRKTQNSVTEKVLIHIFVIRNSWKCSARHCNFRTYHHSTYFHVSFHSSKKLNRHSTLKVMSKTRIITTRVRLTWKINALSYQNKQKTHEKKSISLKIGSTCSPSACQHAQTLGCRYCCNYLVSFDDSNSRFSNHCICHDIMLAFEIWCQILQPKDKQDFLMLPHLHTFVKLYVFVHKNIVCTCSFLISLHKHECEKFNSKQYLKKKKIQPTWALSAKS